MRRTACKTLGAVNKLLFLTSTSLPFHNLKLSYFYINYNTFFIFCKYFLTV